MDNLEATVSIGTVDVSTGTVDVSTGTVDVSIGTVDVSIGTVDVSIGTVDVSIGTVDVSIGTVDVSTGADGADGTHDSTDPADADRDYCTQDAIDTASAGGVYYAQGSVNQAETDGDDIAQGSVDPADAHGNFLYPKIAPGRKIKIIPNLNHPAIIEFLNIVYPIQVRSWNDILSIYISCPELIFYKSVERFSYAGILEIFRGLFRIHQTQTLRKGISSEQDLIVLLRSIAKKYDFHLQSFYTIKRPTKYCMTKNGIGIG